MQLSEVVLQKLLENDLIKSGETLQLQPCHQFEINGKIYSHYVISCESSGKKFFLKLLKPSEGQILCDRYLNLFANPSLCNEYPRIIVSPFRFEENKYFITTFFDAENLDKLLSVIPVQQYKEIGEKIFNRLLELEQLHADKYSDCGNFVDNSFEALFVEKLQRRFSHQVVASLPTNVIDRICSRCDAILHNSDISQPTMIHMDIKPANILYSPCDDKVYLVDFEFARFGDIDYGWAQVLLSGLNAFHPIYKKHIYPHIIKQRTDIYASLQIPKMKCYFLYQTLCNMIYYYDRHLKCPSAFEQIFYHLTKEIAQ